jgi:hypothetical protein
MCWYKEFHIPGDRRTRKTYCVYLEDTAEDLDLSDALDMYNQLVTQPQITGCWEVDGDPREIEEADAAHAEQISIAVARANRLLDAGQWTYEDNDVWIHGEV